MKHERSEEASTERFRLPGPSPERFETILSSISDGVFAVDNEWRITCFNASAERSLGMSRDRVLGRPCHEVLRSNICRDACALRFTMETGRPIINLAVDFRDSRGRRLPVSISTALLRDKRGRIIGGVETFRDLNMVKELIREHDTMAGRIEFVTADARMKHMFEVIPTIARSESTVLVVGESGTGKSLIARSIHDQSSRRDAQMVTVNSGALPASLLESELFGFVKGAFTGATHDRDGRIASAQGGTLFLDEIGDMPLELQVKILRVIQDRRYEKLGENDVREADIRIVAATNRDLPALVEKGLFRSDLYYRLNVMRLEIPPLRERPGDIPLLARHFLGRFSMLRGKNVEGFSPEAMAVLEGYGYPGNARELENVVEHAHVLCTGNQVEVAHLPDWLTRGANPRPSRHHPALAGLEADLIRETLERNGWHRARAAAELGMHRTTLARKIRRLGLELPRRDGRSG
jgi:PAS domain S-box-containing protein